MGRAGPAGRAGHPDGELAVIAAGLAAASALGRLVVSPIDRDAAREAAQRELSKGIYHADDPGLFERMLDSLVGWLDRMLSRAAGVAPGGLWGMLALLVVLVTGVALIVWRTGPLRRRAPWAASDLDVSALVTADEHRRRADAFAQEGRYADAVRERMRAIVRELEDRGVLEPRPARTADEVARDAAAVVPGVAGDLRGAARLFDEIWYGGRPATVGSDAAMRVADQRIRAARLVVAAAPGDSAQTGYQVPR
jgi:hypothetical protein